MTISTAYSIFKSSLTFSLAALFSSSVVHALPTQVWGSTSNANDTGIWDGTGTNLDWSTTSSTATTGGTAWLNNAATPTIASFTGTPGTVTVQNTSPVFFEAMSFNANAVGTYDFEGGTLEYAQKSDNTLVNVLATNKANVTFNNEIEVNVGTPVTPGFTNGGLGIYNSGIGTTLTFNAINVTGVGQSSFTVLGANGTTTIFKGPITADTVNGANTTYMVFGKFNNGVASGTPSAVNSTAVYKIDGPVSYNPINGKLCDVNSGMLYLGSDALGAGAISFVGDGVTQYQMGVLTDKSGLNITNKIYDQNVGNYIVGGSTAGATTFSGEIALGQSGSLVQLNAAAGGTTTFSGIIDGTNYASLSTAGSGTIVLSKTTGNTYTVDTTKTSTAFEMTSGTTTLIQNTSGSAFGANAQTTVVAKIDAGAKFGGNGISKQQIVAADSTSVINPGNGTATVQLHLNGGLAAANGLTMTFDLNGTSNDSIDFATAAVMLNGPIDVSFSNLGSVLTGHVYTLLTGTGAWTGAPAFAIVAPDGYTLDTSYGTGGYLYTTTGGTDSFSVEFATVPEPSTVLLIALSIAGLSFFRWTRRANALNV